MSELQVVAERAVGAPADLIYRCIADFDRHDPRFVPPTWLAAPQPQGRFENGRSGQQGLEKGVALIRLDAPPPP